MLSARELEPALASGGPAVRQPRIYFGRGTDSYVIVKTSTPEFDFPHFGLLSEVRGRRAPMSLSGLM
jgi:uncharacterized membrane protein (UPF0182 family)